MAAQRGKDILLKISDGAETPVFVTVAGLRARTISLNAASVDVTDGDSAGRWRELLAGAGVKQAAVSGAGVFRDAASDALVREVFFAQSGPRLAADRAGLRRAGGALPGGRPGVRGRSRGRGDLGPHPGLGRGNCLRGPVMTANAARGEVVARLAGRERRLCLTLGALAELETAFGAEGWADLAGRLRGLSAGDLTRVLAALLRGAGEEPGDLTAVTPGEAARAVAEAFIAAGS
jgi:TP901-1 family phage major tail protein